MAYKLLERSQFVLGHQTGNMKRFATLAIILLQLWLLSPLCCCWFKAAKASGDDDCCCSRSDESSQKPDSPTKDRSCRCSENKVQLPLQRIATISDTSRQLHPFGQLLAAPTQLASLVLPHPAGPLDFREAPPPLTGTDRLYELPRLIL